MPHRSRQTRTGSRNETTTPEHIQRNPSAAHEVSPMSLNEMPLIQLQPARRIGPRVQIAARRRHVSVPERGLHLGQRSAAVERVASVGVAQFDPRSFRRPLQR